MTIRFRSSYTHVLVMDCTLIFIALLISVTLVESRPQIQFSRPLGSENVITLGCRSSGSTAIIDNAIFRRDGVILNPNDEPVPSYQFHITPDGEGGFTCEEDGGVGERSEVLQLAAKPKEREVDNKVIYVYRGDVIEIPCDYSPGNAADLYSVEWVRTRTEGILSLTLTSLLSEPHLSISPENYSLFVNITELEQNGHRYQCTVIVRSCESCMTSPTFIESGADITLKLKERPQISITRNPDMSTDIAEGDKVEYTCNVTTGPGDEGEIEESIYWQVGSTEFTDCRNATYCVTSTGDNVRVLTVTTAGILTSAEAMTLDIECVVLQEFNDNNIIDPVSYNLTDIISLRTFSALSLIIHLAPLVAITTQPQDQIDIIPGTDITFTVVATGSVLNYQWFKDGESLPEGGKYTGTMTATLTVIDVMESDEGGYQCSVGNNIDSALSMVAVLTTFTTAEFISTTLKTTSIAISSVSMVAVIITLITTIVFRKLRKHDVSISIIQHCIALFCMLLFFLVGIDRIENDIVCTTMSLIIQYFTMASAFWILAETVVTFWQLHMEFERASWKQILVPSLVCWMLPLSLLAVALMTLGTGENYLISADERYCFFSRPDVMLGVFLGPLFSTLLFSFVTFILIARVLLRHRRRKAFAGLLKTTTRTLIGAATITMLFALTWVFGAVAFTDGPDIFLWLFIIFNSLQGLFFCVFQKDTQDAWILLFKYGKCSIYRERKEAAGENGTLETIAHPAVALASVPSMESTAKEKCDNGGITSLKDTLETEVSKKPTKANPAVTLASVPSLEESVAEESIDNGGITSLKDTLETEVSKKPTKANPAVTLASVPSLEESVAEESIDNGGITSLKDTLETEVRKKPTKANPAVTLASVPSLEESVAEESIDNGGITSLKDTLETEVSKKPTKANPAVTLASVPSLEESVAEESIDNGGITSLKDTLETEKVRKANPAVALTSVPFMESTAEENLDNGGVISLKDFPAHSISPMETEGRGEHETSFFGQGPQVLPQPRRLLDQEYIQKLSAQMIVPKKHIRLLNLIGDGEYGIVYKAQICTPERVGSDTDIVAVKTLKGFFDESAIDDMIKESLKMKDLNHPNVLNMLGVCIDGGPAPFIVMPFMANGSLRAYLKKKQPNLIVPENADFSLICGGMRRLVGMCIQIARGMEYLASKKLIHRDLASRNCMIDENFVIKVADFGLSESVYAKSYFRLANHSQAKMPLKWMAPESLNNGIFTENTDVWSFGVVCWEIFTSGKAPYAGVHPLALIVMLENGHRLDKPENAACSGEMYSIMRTCWHADPANRPAFSDIVPAISQIQDSLSLFPALPSSTPMPSAKPIMSQVPSERQHVLNSLKPTSEPRQKTVPAEQSKQGASAACKPNLPKDDYEEITSVYDQLPLPMPEKIENVADQSYEEISGAVYDSLPVLACKDDMKSPIQLNLAEDITTKPVHKPPSISALGDSNDQTGAHPANRKPPAIEHHPSQGRGGLAVRYNRKALPYSRSDPEYVNIPTVIFVRGRFPVPSRRVSTPKPEVESEGKPKRGIITPHSSEHSHQQNAPIVPPKPGVIAAATAGKPKRGTTALHRREPPSDYRGGKLLRHAQEVGSATNKSSSPLEVSDNYETISKDPYESVANYESISKDPYESIALPYESITASPYDMIVPPMASCLPLPNHDDREEDENTIGLNDGAPNDPVQRTDPTIPANVEN